jgi:dTDP-D-glucose 4,6-dehydratase
MAGLADNTVGQTINLGSGYEIAINDLVREVARIAGQSEAAVVHDDPRPGDVLRLCADTTKARQLLGFEPKVTLGEGHKPWTIARSFAGARDDTELGKIRSQNQEDRIQEPVFRSKNEKTRPGLRRTTPFHSDCKTLDGRTRS